MYLQDSKPNYSKTSKKMKFENPKKSLKGSLLSSEGQ
jgi:hypothetical protein